MKKSFAPAAALSRLRPGRRAILLLVFLLALSAPLVILTWRSLPADRLTAPPLPAEKPAAAVEAPAPPEPLPAEHAAPLPAETEAAVPAAADRWELRWPLAGEIIAGHHEVYRINNQLRLHVGVDIAADPAAPVLAAGPGVVSEVREDALLGLVLEIDHGGEYISLYGNLAEVFFAVGEQVKGGESIARVGSTARLDASTGDFLHFALYRKGVALDPVQAINK